MEINQEQLAQELLQATGDAATEEQENVETSVQEEQPVEVDVAAVTSKKKSSNKGVEKLLAKNNELKARIAELESNPEKTAEQQPTGDSNLNDRLDRHEYLLKNPESAEIIDNLAQIQAAHPTMTLSAAEKLYWSQKDPSKLLDEQTRNKIKYGNNAMVGTVPSNNMDPASMSTKDMAAALKGQISSGNDILGGGLGY